MFETSSSDWKAECHFALILMQFILDRSVVIFGSSSEVNFNLTFYFV